MAKFAVGEKCLARTTQGPTKGEWLPVVVTALPGKWKASPLSYEIEAPTYSGPKWGYIWLAFEENMRKLPPDSHADDTTEDPGVTRLKKLLEQDTKPQKRTKRERA